MKCGLFTIVPDGEAVFDIVSPEAAARTGRRNRLVSLTVLLFFVETGLLFETIDGEWLVSCKCFYLCFDKYDDLALVDCVAGGTGGGIPNIESLREPLKFIWWPSGFGVLDFC